MGAGGRKAAAEGGTPLRGGLLATWIKEKNLYLQLLISLRGSLEAAPASKGVGVLINC